jgi:FkbM family methyltransferase
MDTGHSAERVCRLPNNMEIAYQSRSELPHFYEDIFEKEVYVQHGVMLEEGACVFDVGANVGLFTLFTHYKVRDARVYAFEPAPPLFRILTSNVERHGVSARLFNHGVSDAERTATFTFYPNSSGMSSFYPDREEEEEALRAILQNQARRGEEGMDDLMRHMDDLLEERFRGETFECRLRPLSAVIREESVERIDLLKIDVQKSEVDVLKGLGEEDWKKVRQIVIEVHDIGGRLDEVTAMLEARGYRVEAEQDDMYEGSVLYNLYAVRRVAARETFAATGQAAPALAEARERARKQEAALQRQRQLMKQRGGGR